MSHFQGPPRRRPMAGGGGGHEDLLSPLPDDVLLLILDYLPSTAAAARTSLLSRRWRHFWAHLPELCFPHPTDLACVRAAPSAPVFRRLQVSTLDASPDATAAVLLLAAPRLAGELFFHNVTPGDREEEEEEAGERGAFEMPCFEKAIAVCLSLGYVGALRLPPSGVFAKLTALHLDHVRLDGRCDLGDGVSSARCPLLQELRVHNTRGLSNLAVHLESLLHVELHNVDGLLQLTVVAPMLKVLDVRICFIGRQLVSNISVPALETLWWTDAHDPSSVQLGVMACLKTMATFGNRHSCVWTD